MNNSLLETQFLYGHVAEQDDELTDYWYYDIGVAKKMARKNGGKCFIIKKTETYEVVDEVNE